MVDYAHAFASLTPETVDSLCARASEDVHFRDPFNDLHGREAMHHLLMDMFQRAGRPDFSVDDICWHEVQQVGWLRWHFSADLPVIGMLKVEGCTRILLDAQGRVCEHLDYWDSAPIYLRLPLVGALLRKIRRRISAAE
ncbi:MAG: nuclear transport factor 2 family protein [Oceanospirillales bacterium]|nr:nuclear transport factor 2 family protein [Oceanospirillales bacterium]